MPKPSTQSITVFTCQDQFDAMMSCIYDAWASRLGHSNIRLMTEPVGNLELFCTYYHIDSDQEKTESVIRSIKYKISLQAYYMIYQVAMSKQKDKLDIIYRFLTAGFYYGAAALDFLHEPVIMRFLEIQRTVTNEAHHFQEFIRFSNMEQNVLVSHIEPKNDILTLIAPHFADRMPSENWMIIDDNRKTAIVHPCNQNYYLIALTKEELNCLSKAIPDPFINLWKTFFHAISIKERQNPQCQKNLLPLWYRHNMTEFKNDN